MKSTNLEIGEPLFFIVLDRLMSVGDVKVLREVENCFLGDVVENRRGAILIDCDGPLDGLIRYLAPEVGYPIYSDEGRLIYRKMRMRNIFLDDYEKSPLVLDSVGISRYGYEDLETELPNED